MVIFHNDNNMITLTTFVHCTSGGESLHKSRSASGSNLTIIEKETGTRLKGGLFATYVIPFVFLATSSPSNAIYLTVMSASGLDSVKTTAILFWVFLFGSPVLWFLSVIFEDVILPESAEDIFLLVVCGICTTSQSYFYIMAAQLLYPTVLSVVETFGIAIFFIVQISFLENIYGPENLPLQMASIIVVFLISVGLPVLEILDAKGNDENESSGILNDEYDRFHGKE